MPGRIQNRFLDPDRPRVPARSIWLRIIWLAALLIAIIVFHDEIGQGAANCLGAFRNR
jgi:hypothetical protein